MIDPEDMEFKDIIKNARRKLETPMVPVMPCKTCKKNKHGETRSKYHPISGKDLSRLHQFSPKVLPGVFFGYALHAVKCGKRT